jgi:hypothetical protein
MTVKDDKLEPRTDDAAAAKKSDGILPDTVRKALVTGLGALFMTEESLRNLVAEMRLPKEATSYLVKQAEAAKAQVVDTVMKEVRHVVESINIGAEIQKILSSMVIEVKTEIRLVPAEEGLVKPKVSTTVHARRARDRKGERDTDSGDD